MERLNKNKKILEDVGIFHNCFVWKFLPKLKTYKRFASETSRKIINICRNNQRNTFN
jgi:hypothetical protein